MKVKVVAISLIAANFTFSTVANAQWGSGVYGGQQSCGYPQGAAPGAVSVDDDYADLLQTRKDLKTEAKDLECQIRDGKCDGEDSLERKRQKAKEEIEKDFMPYFATAFERHMEDQMNCDICGVSSAPLNPVQDFPPRNGGGGWGQSAPQNPPPAAPPTVTVAQSAPLAPVQNDPNAGALKFKNAPAASAPKSVVPDDDGTDATPSRAGTYSDCLAMDKVAKAMDTKKKGSAASYCIKKHNMSAQYTLPQDFDPIPGYGGRMPASENQSRMPASLSDPGGGGPHHGGGELGHNGGVSAGANVQDDSQTAPDDDGFKDFDPGRGSFSSSGGPSKCYSRTEAKFYNSHAWKFACGDNGKLNPDVCRTNGFVQGHPDSTKCQSALDKYLSLSVKIQQKQKTLADMDKEIDQADDDIADWKDSHKKGQSSDDAILAARAQRKQQSASTGRSGPSFGQALGSIALGLGAGVGVGALINHQEHKEYDSYLNGVNAQNSNLEALGWQGVTPYPYQSSGAGLAAGMGVFSGVTGGLLSSFGCGSMGGGVNSNVFGNPYASNPYAQMGGGMFNGVNSGGVAGPWGNGAGLGFGGQMPYGYAQGFALGGAIGAAIGGYPGYAAGGYPGYGAIGAAIGGYPGYAAGGYPGVAIGGAIGAAIGGYPGYASGLAVGGYPGYGAIGAAIGGYPGYAGGYPGVAIGGAIGAAIGGYPGYASGLAVGGYPGYGALGGAIGSALGGYAGYDPRTIANQQGSQIQAQQLYGVISGAQNQLGLIGSGYVGGIGTAGYALGGYPGYSAYPSYGAYPSYYGSVVGASLGIGYMQGYATSSLYNPYSSLYTNPYLSGTVTGSILTNTSTILPTVPTNNR